MRGKKKKRPGEKDCDGIIKDAAFPVCIGWWGFRERERERENDTVYKRERENVCVEMEKDSVEERERMFVLRERESVRNSV